MVKLMLDGLGGNCRGKKRAQTRSNESAIECFHVNAQLSSDLGNIGKFDFRKIFCLLRYCGEAIWCRFRYCADTFYYIPAPPKRIAFYRDLLVLLLCRPFFRHIIFHWEAGGLGAWVRDCASGWERWLAQRLLGSPTLSITLAESLSHDAIYFKSKRIRVAPNGIPDPCPEFEVSVLPVRLARLARRLQLLEQKTASTVGGDAYRVVFLAHCTREKGVFDALSAVALANQKLEAQNPSARITLTVAGAFLREDERQEFDSWQREHPGIADYAGFLGAEAKQQLLRESDCLCFPSYYPAEAQPVSIVEAMAFGLAIVATNWRGISELLPENYLFLISDHNPSVIAQALIESMQADVAAELRLHYRTSLTAEVYVKNMSGAFQSLRHIAS